VANTNHLNRWEYYVQERGKNQNISDTQTAIFSNIQELNAGFGSIVLGENPVTKDFRGLKIFGREWLPRWKYSGRQISSIWRGM